MSPSLSIQFPYHGYDTDTQGASMTKIFATDFDGTLYFHNEPEPIRATDLDAIRTFQEGGGLFGACTGRPVRALTTQTLGVVPFDFYIALSGATLHDRNVEPIVPASLPRPIVREIYDRFAPYARDNTALVCAADDYWTFDETLVEAWPISWAPDFDHLPDPMQGFGLETTTIEEAQELADRVNREYAGIACAYVNLASIDVLPVGHSKGTGLRIAAEHFDATLTAGIGDSYNDLPLLEAADVAYTFHTAPEDMKAHADVLVDSVAEAIADFMAR